MIGIKKQTAWYAARAKELDKKTFEMLTPIICDALIEIGEAIFLIESSLILSRIAMDQLFPKDQRWYPVKKFQDPLFCDEVKNVRKFQATFNLKK